MPFLLLSLLFGPSHRFLQMVTRWGSPPLLWSLKGQHIKVNNSRLQNTSRWIKNSAILHKGKKKSTISVAFVYRCPYAPTIQHTQAYMIPLLPSWMPHIVIHLLMQKRRIIWQRNSLCFWLFVVTFYHHKYLLWSITFLKNHAVLL